MNRKLLVRFSSAGWSSDGWIPKTMSSLTWPSTRRERMIGRFLPQKWDSVCFSINDWRRKCNKIKSAESSRVMIKRYKQMGFTNIYHTLTSLQGISFNPCDSVLLHLYFEVVEVCLFSENTKEWINCYKDGDVSSSVVFNSGFSWVESLSYDRNEWVELHKQMGAAKAQIILRDVDFQWLLQDVLISKMSMPLVRSCVDYVTKAVDHSKTVVTYSDFINKDSMAQSLERNRLSQNELQLVLASTSIAHAWLKLLPCKTTGYLLSMHLSRDPKDQSKRYIPIDCWKTQTNSIVTVSSAHLHLWGGSKVEGVGGLLSVRRDALHSMCHLELDVKRHMPCTGGILVVWWAIFFSKRMSTKTSNNHTQHLNDNQIQSMNINEFCSIESQSTVGFWSL